VTSRSRSRPRIRIIDACWLAGRWSAAA
jgi:hypothetical protein